MISINYAKRYCSEDITLIENYEQAINDETQIWHCHHRLETDENKSPQQLKDECRYLKVPANELIFIKSDEHITLHNKQKTGKTRTLEQRQKMSIAKSGKHLTNEHKKKISESNKGKHYHWKGKHRSEETKKKISESSKGKIKLPITEETRKKMSEAHKGKQLSEETKQKMREARLKYLKNKHENQ